MKAKSLIKRCKEWSLESVTEKYDDADVCHSTGGTKVIQVKETLEVNSMSAGIILAVPERIAKNFGTKNPPNA